MEVLAHVSGEPPRIGERKSDAIRIPAGVGFAATRGEFSPPHGRLRVAGRRSRIGPWARGLARSHMVKREAQAPPVGGGAFAVVR